MTQKAGINNQPPK